MTTIQVKEQMMSLTITQSNIKRAVKSYTMSKRYINTMLKATVINILYHRLDVEESAFITKTFNDIPFKSFKPKSKNHLIRDFHAYMIACKDAIEKNYLRELYLYFIDSESEDILENYKFSFNYGDKQQVEKCSQDEQDLTENTCELLQNLNDLSRHNKLSSNIQLKVEFTYFEDTPEDYEPPGFRGIEESESLIKKLNKNGNSVTIGTLFTGFHKLKCRGRGAIFNFNESGTLTNLEIEKDNLPETDLMTEDYTAEEQDSNIVHAEVHVNKDLFTEDLSPNPQEDLNNPSIFCNLTSGEQCSNGFNDTYISQRIDLADSGSENSDIDCPCSLPSKLGEWKADTFKCEKCKQKFHASCQGYLDNTFFGGAYQCLHCREETDSIFDAFKGQTSKPVYRIRYILACAYKMSRLPKEIKTLFQQTARNLHLTEDGKQAKLNMDLLKALFKFDHKMPDERKLNLDH